MIWVRVRAMSQPVFASSKKKLGSDQVFFKSGQKVLTRFAMSTPNITNVQHVVSPSNLVGRLLLIITCGKKNNFIGGFKLTTYNNLPTKICYESIVDVRLFFLWIDRSKLFQTPIFKVW